MKKIMGGIVRKMLVFTLALQLSAVLGACSSGEDKLETFAPAESRTFQFESEDMPKIKENPTVAPLEESEEMTAEAAEETTPEETLAPETAAAETTAAETTTVSVPEYGTYPDGIYRVMVSPDDLYMENGELRVKADVRSYVYFEKSYIDSLGVGSVIPLGEYGLDDIAIEYVFEDRGDWFNVDDTYSFQPDPDGSERWVLCEMNDLPISYISGTMDANFVPLPNVVDNFALEYHMIDDPREFFETYDFVSEWPVTMELRFNQIIGFEYEYRP